MQTNHHLKLQKLDRFVFVIYYKCVALNDTDFKIIVCVVVLLTRHNQSNYPRTPFKHLIDIFNNFLTSIKYPKYAMSLYQYNHHT